MRIKIEMNTFERSPARPTVARAFSVSSPWFSGNSEVPTFALEELAATKIRALFQRKKGSDLFDPWLAVEQAGVRPVEVAACFSPYRPEGWTASRALANLNAKIDDREFTRDLEQLLSDWPADYSIQSGAEVAQRIIERIDEEKESRTEPSERAGLAPARRIRAEQSVLDVLDEDRG